MQPFIAGPVSNNVQGSVLVTPMMMQTQDSEHSWLSVELFDLKVVCST